MNARDRVREEKAALDEKIGALQAFLGSQAFAALDEGPQKLLIAQGAVMTSFSMILTARLAMWGDE